VWYWPINSLLRISSLAAQEASLPWFDRWPVPQLPLLDCLHNTTVVTKHRVDSSPVAVALRQVVMSSLRLVFEVVHRAPVFSRLYIKEQSVA